jgi:hypothetical protein
MAIDHVRADEIMTTHPVLRISRGHFAPEIYGEVRRLIETSAGPFAPALKQLRGLIYYHAAVDPVTSTVVNASITISKRRGRWIAWHPCWHSGPSWKMPALSLIESPVTSLCGR